MENDDQSAFNADHSQYHHINLQVHAINNPQPQQVAHTSSSRPSSAAAHLPVSSSPHHRQIGHLATITTPRHKKPTEPHRVVVSTILQRHHNRVVFSNPKQRYKPSAAATTKSHPPAAAVAPTAATTTRLSALTTP